jgi:dTDP-4-dehydrorhamnose reductase
VCTLKKSGINIKSVTAWSLLGAFDWDSLLTRKNNHYESGVFDISDKGLRKTALAKLIYSLATTGDFWHPVLQEKGWWQRNEKSKNNSARAEKKARYVKNS